MMTKQNCIDFSDTPQYRSSMPQSWGSWMAAGRLLAAREVRNLKATLEIWSFRYSSRRALAAMDDHRLADVGITRLEAEAEAQKPFWTA